LTKIYTIEKIVKKKRQRGREESKRKRSMEIFTKERGKTTDRVEK